MFGQALGLIADFLARLKADGSLDGYCVIGGLAVAAWGHARATGDIDCLVAIGPGGPGAVTGRALEAGFDCRYTPGGLGDPLRGVFRLAVPAGQTTIPVQLVAFDPPFSAAILGEAVPVTLFGTPLPVVSWPYLVLLKLYAAGPLDLLDAREILRAQAPSEAELSALTLLAKRFGLGQALVGLLQEPDGRTPPGPA